MKQHIFFVDDEPGVRKVVGKTLERVGLKVRCFACAADCLEQLHSKMCDLLITDVKMPEMDGIELLTEAKRIFPWLQVLVITGYGDIQTAVKAIKAGASDYIEKPLDRQGFLMTVKSILKQDASTFPRFTKMEWIILRLLLKGKSTREIADVLHRHRRTIEDHRSNIYKKIGVRNQAGLFRWAAKMGLMKMPEDE
jgi:two-component system response regulator FixJ